MAQMVNNLPARHAIRVQYLGWEDPLEKGMAPHSRILAWRIPWTEATGMKMEVASENCYTIHPSQKESLEGGLHKGRVFVFACFSIYKCIYILVASQPYVKFTSHLACRDSDI